MLGITDIDLVVTYLVVSENSTANGVGNSKVDEARVGTNMARFKT